MLSVAFDFDRKMVPSEKDHRQLFLMCTFLNFLWGTGSRYVALSGLELAI